MRFHSPSRFLLLAAAGLAVLALAQPTAVDVVPARAGEGEASNPAETGTGEATASADDGALLEWLSPLRTPADWRGFTPEAITVDGLGRLFVLDRAGGRIARIDEGGVRLFGVGDQGGDRYPNLSALYAQWGMDLYALDPAAGVLYQFDLDGHLRRRIDYLSGLRAGGRPFVHVSDFLLSKAGELILVDRTGGLLLLDRSGKFTTDLAAGAAGSERLQAPVRAALGPDGQVFVLDPAEGWIRRFTRQGTARPGWRYTPAQPDGAPPLLAITPDAEVVLAAHDLRWIRYYSSGGELLLEHRVAPQDRVRCTSMAAGPDGILYIASPSSGEVLRLQRPPVEDDDASGR